MHKLYIVTGASGAGKTTLIKSFEKEGLADFVVRHFDDIGVPSHEEMVKEYGSGQEWQRMKTIEWVRKIKEELLPTTNVILDAQTRPAFIDEACQENGVTNFEIILVDCADEVRKERLHGRGQPELDNDRMTNWAKYLRDDCGSRGCKIIDNSMLTLEESLTEFKRFVGSAVRDEEIRGEIQNL